MGSLIVNMVIASAAVTALINVVPRLFPGSSAEDRIRDLVGEPRPSDVERSMRSPEERPKLRVWFPWKSMLVGSIIITLIVNLIAFFS